MRKLPKDGTSIPQESHPEVIKKQYASPRLIEYGSLAKLTQGGSNKGADTGAGAFTKMCL